METEWFREVEKSYIENTQHKDSREKSCGMYWGEGKEDDGPMLLVHVCSASVLQGILVMWKEEKKFSEEMKSSIMQLVLLLSIA